jgi:hypothetical protein
MFILFNIVEPIRKKGLDALFCSDLIVIQMVNNGDVPPFLFFHQDYNSPSGAGYEQCKLNRFI